VILRPATAQDIPELCRLLALLFSQEADFTPDPARQARALDLILARPEVGRLFCVDTGGHLAGMVSILFTVSTAEGGRAAWLEDMVIDPAARNQGLGRDLLEFAIAEARRAGCSRITLLTDEDNLAAQRFYTRSGFKPSRMRPFRLQFQG